MTREEKKEIIQNLTNKINETSHFYLTDISALNAADTSDLRRKCFEKDINLMVVKNTLLKKALENSEGNFDELYELLKDSTSIMFCDTGNVPAKLIKDFRKKHEKPIIKGAYVEQSVYIGDNKKHEKPIIKGAYVEQSVYIGDNQLDTLASLKSKEELIGDVILMLQSPAQKVISGLQSGGGKLAGILKTLSEKE